MLLAPAVGRAADLRRIESVGVFPLGSGPAGGRAPRDGAVRAAVARAVEGVAEGLMPEGWHESVPASPPKAEPADLKATLAPALGSDPFEYATRFRILEDRGPRDALLSRDPDVDTEYVAVVEVFVDVGRVRDRLHTAGWIVVPAGQEATQVLLVVTGLGSFGAYEALRRTLLEELEVRSALPVELSRGRAVLAVDGPYGAEALEAALRTLLVDWTPPADPAPPAAGAEAEFLDDALPAD
jgi:hypothetical protein